MPKVVVVTGATSGVGRAAVRAFADAGWDVGLLARGEDALEAAVKEVEAAGRRALGVPVDVADSDGVERAAEEIESGLGPIDVWVNDAMATVFGQFLDLTAEEFERVTAVTYLGYVNGTRAALRRMQPRGHGVVVQVGSALAYRGIPLQAAYCGAKHAIKGFTDAVRTELLHERSDVRIVEVHLPAMNTPQFSVQRSRLRRRAQPVPPIFQPEVAAQAIVAAASGRRRAVHVSVATLATAIGGFLLPSFVDGYLGRVGYESQQTDEPERGPDDAGDGLDDPLPGDAGAHGRFDAVARTRSRQLDLSLSSPVAATIGTVGRISRRVGALVASCTSAGRR